MCLENDRLPPNADEARKLQVRALKYALIEAHPQANGQAEVANRIILNGLKKRVEKAPESWADELLPILWAYRTTYEVSSGTTRFQLAYGAVAVVPLEINHTSTRIQKYELAANIEEA
ncbi:uncharacterized protein LOC108203526 [Daucus carota subsp. sativus]|uniref:uncharacterized protein LOC108203526 n=1 Tax=Daucus carota subsp. sativus TaxID=79200 RepID=UPI0007EF7F97|nr:PREDICTED: uncharacterized protein LOC108203526 [Daucus carota subsp. sativus]